MGSRKGGGEAEEAIMMGGLAVNLHGSRLFFQVCPLCDRICKARNFFRSMVSLRMHMRKKHGVQVKYACLKCPDCDFKAAGTYDFALRELRLHIIRDHVLRYMTATR